MSKLLFKPMDPWDHQSVPPLSKHLKEQLNGTRKYHGNCAYEAVPVSEALRIIDSGPDANTAYHFWWAKERPTLQARALAHHQAANPAQQGQQPAPMCGHHVIDFYIKLLHDHFALDRASFYEDRYNGLQQTEDKTPSQLLADMRQCEPHLHAMPPDKFAMDFVHKLHHKIVPNVKNRWDIIAVTDWYGRISDIAKDADIAWDNYRREQSYQRRIGGAVSASSTGGTMPASSTGAGPSSSSESMEMQALLQAIRALGPSDRAKVSRALQK